MRNVPATVNFQVTSLVSPGSRTTALGSSESAPHRLFVDADAHPGVEVGFGHGSSIREGVPGFGLSGTRCPLPVAGSVG